MELSEDLSQNMEQLETLNSEEAEICSSDDDNSKHEASANPTSHYSKLYKIVKMPLGQEERRRRLLEEMKRRRNQAVDDKRDLDLSSEDEGTILEEEMEVEHKKRRKKKKRKKTQEHLMFSEWFVEVPNDLQEKWLVKLCPVGVQTLVVAHRGFTESYNKSRLLLSRFQSALPGGNRYSRSGRTILNCIYSRQHRLYFVLDVIAWKSRFVKLAEAEFRFFWIKCKLEETPDVQEISPKNHFPFVELESFPAELPLIQSKLSQPFLVNSEETPLDGVLFFHKEAHYIDGTTPLVGWLKPFMIPEVLNVSVSECFVATKADNYVSLRDYIERKANKKEKGKEIQMET